jgi:hypothetical protein
MEELYYMDRGENTHVFAQIKKDKKNYQVKIFFKSGNTHVETWTEEDFNEMIENQSIAKATKMDWSDSFEKPKIKKGKKK